LKKKKDAEFISRWDAADHDGKKALAEEYGIAYTTARHWRSDDSKPIVLKEVTIETPPDTTPIQLDIQGESLVAVINDTHIPFHDPEILEAVEKFLGKVQPDVLFYNGDIIDFYQISEYEKDPARISMMQSEVDVVKKMFDRHAKLMPTTQRWFITGTHERRLQRFLWSKSPALSSLRCLTLDSLLGLSERGIKLVDFEQGVIINGIFLVLHGDITSIYSGYTAKRLYEKHGGCGIAGHCHRAGSYYKRDRFGTWGWFENGCLCSLNPDWLSNPNWTQGFSLIHFNGSRFYVEQIPIINGRFMYGGDTFGRKQ
jgi:hypothetical protein